MWSSGGGAPPPGDARVRTRESPGLWKSRLGSLGDKTKNAIQLFIREARAKRLGNRYELFSGPDNQVIVSVLTTRPAAIRSYLGRLSAKILQERGVWLVGLPRKSEKTKQHSIDALLVRRKK